MILQKHVKLHTCYKMKEATHSASWTAQLKCIFILTVFLMAWNVHLQIGLHYNYTKIQELMKTQEKSIISPDVLSGERQKRDLVNRRSFGGFESGVQSENTASHNDGDNTGLLASLFGEEETSGGLESSPDQIEHGKRMRRDQPTGSETAAAVSGSRRADNPTNKKKRRSSNSASAHFHAFVDVERLEREKQNDINSTLGEFRELGFMPYERMYRFWKPAEWNQRSTPTYFQLNSTSGRLKVKKPGFYLIYAQIMYHTTAARKSFGIHIDDDVTPFVESLSFDTLQYNRAKRHLGHSRGSETGNSSSLLRHQRSAETGPTDYSSYSQCSTFAVAHIRKNQEVFLMSGDSTMKTLIVRPAMTFWGIAKL